MGTIRFGEVGVATAASVAPQDMTKDMTIVRGINGCAMASDRG
jgi:hypothetical protein